MKRLTPRLRMAIKRRLERAPRVFFFLDYDGTLTPLCKRPERARLDPAVRSLLRRLAARSGFDVAVITGRKLADVKSLVRLRNVIYAGNHGLELEGPDFKYRHAKAVQSRRSLEAAAAAISPLLRDFPGSFLEDKGITLTFHYRGVEPCDAHACRRRALEKLSAPALADTIRITEGKKAVEIRPGVDWHKGSAVRWLLLHQDPESLPLYIGDDCTDESAFRALDGRGVTVRVGRRPGSRAQYFVDDAQAAVQFLQFLSADGR